MTPEGLGSPGSTRRGQSAAGGPRDAGPGSCPWVGGGYTISSSEWVQQLIVADAKRKENCFTGTGEGQMKRSRLVLSCV